MPSAGMGSAASLDSGRPEQTFLRFLTCGSVDDGKSTLIGRLLYDSKLVFEDQLSAVERDSRRFGTTGEEVDFALLVDGLEAEREQGITIDVAYRYFATPRRSFIVADTPGHEQYTRNMATGASTADLAVILVDASKGLLPQTRRHSIICSLLGIRAVVLAVNKMDLVSFDQDRFASIVEAYKAFATQLEFEDITAIPIAARHGDNVTAPSPRMPWYEGKPLLAHLETVDVPGPDGATGLRMAVQWVNRPDASFRGYSGTIAAGAVRPGDAVVVHPSGNTAHVERIVTYDGDLGEAGPGEAVTLTLDREIDVARGDLFSSPDDRPLCADQFAAHLIWMSEEALLPGRSYLMRIGTKFVPARVTGVRHVIDVNTLGRNAARTLRLNEVGLCQFWTAAPVAFDPYRTNRQTGSFILVDRESNATVGAGMVLHALRRATNIHRHHHSVDKAARASLKHQRPCVLWFTGLSASGKSTIADLVEKELHARAIHTMMLDGDNVRHGLNRDLGFTPEDRVENIRRVGEVAKLLVEAGLVVICSFISPYAAERSMVRELLGQGEFFEIFVDVPLDECIRRDPKGLYRKALAGEITNFTGIGSPYEAPKMPDLRIDGMRMNAEEAAGMVLSWLAQHQPQLD